MEGAKKNVFYAFVLVGLAVIAVNIPTGSTQSSEAVARQAVNDSPRLYKDKLVPTKIMEVMPVDRGGYVGIMAGVDGNHLIQISLRPNQIYQGQDTEISESVVVAYNGHNNLFIHSRKYGTRAEVIINSINHKFKKAFITISGDLVSTGPDKEHLEIVPVTLELQGENYRNLMAKAKE